MATVREHVRKFKAAHRLASDILASSHAGLPDENHIHSLATQLFVHNIKATDGAPTNTDHAGQDSDSENMLRQSYDTGRVDQQSEN
jgi:hypothetical protein